jgi:hypothetical protein
MFPVFRNERRNNFDIQHKEEEEGCLYVLDILPVARKEDD